MSDQSNYASGTLDTIGTLTQEAAGTVSYATDQVDGTDVGDDTPGSTNVGFLTRFTRKTGRAIVAIEAMMGTNPKGTFADTGARLNARQTCRKTADQTNATTTLAAVTDLSLPVATTGLDYRFMFEAWWSSNTAGIVAHWDVTSPTVGGRLLIGWESFVRTAPATVAPGMAEQQVLSGSGVLHNPTGGTSLPAANVPTVTRCFGMLSNPTATGVLQLRFRIETTTATITCFRGSFGEIYIN